MKKLSKRTSPLWLYGILLILAVSAMIWARHIRHHTINESDIDFTSIDVGIQYAPLSFYMYDDTLGGFDYDLLRLIERMQNVRFTLHPITTAAEGIAGLRRGSFRLVAADLPMTSDMTDSVLFTQPVYLDRQILVQQTDSAGSTPLITSVLDLCGDTVYLPASPAMCTRIANLCTELGDTIHSRELPLSPEQLFVATALGHVSRSVINEQTAKALAEHYPDVDISTSISFTQFQPWMLRIGDVELKKLVNSWITAAKATPEYKALLQRYTDTQLPATK